MFTASLAIALTASSASIACMDPPGDVTNDSVTNVIDVMCTALTSLWALEPAGGPAPECIEVAFSEVDLNCDQSVTVTDLVMSIQLSLGIPLNPFIDSDGDLCADNCDVQIPEIITGTFGGGAVRAAHDGTLTLDAQIGTRQIQGKASDGTLSVQAGIPSGGAL